MQTWALTDPGNVRTQNQDAYAIVPLEGEKTLLIVCDGMGGAKSGNIASEMAVDVFTTAIRNTQRDCVSAESTAKAMREALELANRAVFEQSGMSEEYHGMGTTLVAALIKEGTAVVINVGDSRAYAFTDKGVQVITRDHSIVEYMVERGELSAEQAKNYPGKNVITRAVGTEETVEGDVYVLPLEKNDSLLLCTDGLSNEMADQEMLFEVAYGVNKSDCCQRLLQIAKTRGAPDNVTMILCTV